MQSGNRHILRLAALLAALVCHAAQAAATTDEDSSVQSPQWQSRDSIRAAAQTHVAATLDDKGSHTRVEASELDTRLRLPACPEPLRTETPYGHSRSNRVTVRVSCPAQESWRIHVPVEIVTVAQVVTITRALARGSVLSGDDLGFVEANLGQLGHGYFLDPANVVGQRLKRALPTGSVVTPMQLETPPVIRRGQNVTIVANSRGIGVKMIGKALEDGAIGQLIDIENTASGKRRQGVVRSARVVEILLR